jgi:hypothetical protein
MVPIYFKDFVWGAGQVEDKIQGFAHARQVLYH